jgi:hypothetical protein
MEQWEIIDRINRLDAAMKRTRRMAGVGILIAFGSGVGVAARFGPSASAQSDARFLTVRELTVVDDKGVPRVRLGAPLPDPTVLGKQVPRQGVVSGVMIYDADGDERGGYVTEAHGDAFLTLDAKEHQQAVFVANRDGGANLSVWSGANRNDNYVSVRAVPDPLVEVVQNGRKQVFTAVNGSRAR